MTLQNEPNGGKFFRPLILLLVTITLCGSVQLDRAGAVEPQRLDGAIERGIKFLAQEVPLWQKENDCASCHHQGDATRALIEAHRLGILDAKSAIQTSLAWLARPLEWHTNRGLPEANDAVLSNMQFASSLLDVREAFGDQYSGAVRQAATIISHFQLDDGSWTLSGGETLPSPITQGSILLTGRAINALRMADAIAYKDRIDRATRWVADVDPRSTVAASSLLITLQAIGTAHRLHSKAVEIILDSQSESGGVGPHKTSPDENYDTALAIVALVGEPESDRINRFVEKACVFLIEAQHEIGSWSGTTRPRGAESYAHLTSTTAWAVRALMRAKQKLK